MVPGHEGHKADRSDPLQRDSSNEPKNLSRPEAHAISDPWTVVVHSKHARTEGRTGNGTVTAMSLSQAQQFWGRTCTLCNDDLTSKNAFKNSIKTRCSSENQTSIRFVPWKRTAPHWLVGYELPWGTLRTCCRNDGLHSASPKSFNMESVLRSNAYRANLMTKGRTDLGSDAQPVERCRKIVIFRL